MELFEAMRSRKSTRDFSDQPIMSEDIDRLIEAIGYRPSAGGFFSVDVRVVRDKEFSKLLLDQCPKASAYFVMYLDDLRPFNKYYGRAARYVYQEAGHISQNLYLAAAEMGIGTCAIGAFDDKAVQKRLGLMGNQLILCVQAFGNIKKEEKK